MAYLDGQQSLLDRKTADGTIYRKIGFFIVSFLFSVVNLLILLFGLMAGHFFRIKSSDDNHRVDSGELGSRQLKMKSFDKKVDDFMYEKDERRMPAFSFKHQIQNIEEKVRRIEEEEKANCLGYIPASEKKNQHNIIAADIHSHQFLSENTFDPYKDENFIRMEADMRFLSAEDFVKPPVESIFEGETDSDNKKPSNFLQNLGKEDDFIDWKYQIYEKEKSNSWSSETNSTGDRDIRFISEDFYCFDIESDLDSSTDGYSVVDFNYDSDVCGFLSEKDYGEQVHDLETSINSVNLAHNLEQVQFESLIFEVKDDGDLYHSLDLHNGGRELKEDNHTEKLLPVGEKVTMKSNSDQFFAVNELIKKPDSQLELHGVELLSMKIEKSTQLFKDFNGDEMDSSQRIDSSGNALYLKDVRTNYDLNISISKMEETKPQKDLETIEWKEDESKTTKSDSETKPKKDLETEDWRQDETKATKFDSEELDEQWEHQELIEQLKMELKKVRSVGLPTISENFESPRTIEDLKPFKVDEKFLREHPLNELQMFYKSYRERMRKFDILNNQKMYAIGILQVQNPHKSMGIPRPLLSAIMSCLSQNITSFCHEKIENEPSKKLIKDLRCDLETVYVGQICLSWEFLRWQYEISHDLAEFNPQNSHQYNQVACEFQHFQVLVQRFIENERFQGPRLPNYIKQRCVLRNLLQVPVIKEDLLKDRKESDYAINKRMLESIMEEAINIFWEFVRTEKDETPILIKVLMESNAEVQDPTDYELMDEIQSNLQKKEKNLKGILRTGNCIVRKFKKPQEDRTNQDLFFSQVDLKLVSRVLKMPRITSDQLHWCHKKLSKISFSERRVRREPSFLLFPA